MSVYTHNEISGSPSSYWFDQSGFIAIITGTAVVVQNADGTQTILVGSGFSGTVGTQNGTTGTLTTGTITSLSRTSFGGGVTYETVSGFSYGATQFSSQLASSGLQGIAAAVFAGTDTFNGFNGNGSQSPGNDNFRGFAGNDTFNGGQGFDTVDYSGSLQSGPVSITLSAASQASGPATGTDALNSIERVIGSSAGDTFTVTAGYIGEFGSPYNEFEGRAGNDTISGNGNTALSFASATSAVSVNFAGGLASGDASVGTDTFAGVNRATGSASNDTMTGDGNGNGLFGRDGNDLLYGLAGNDTFDGGAGIDSLFGGIGDDTYFVDTYRDQVSEDPGEGFDVVFSTGSYIMLPNIEMLVLEGTSQIDGLGNDLPNRIVGNGAFNGIAGGLGNDTLEGGSGDDDLNGQQGADSMLGESGIDTYHVDVAGDFVGEDFNGGEYDTIWTTISVTLPANVEILILDGGNLTINGTGNDVRNLMLGNDANNTLAGLGGDDVILGKGGVDQIDGGPGFDIISGGAGADVLTGGTGNDYFVFTSFAEGGDLITDFTVAGGPNEDIVDLRSLRSQFSNPAAITSTDQAMALGYLIFLQDEPGPYTYIYADPNGGDYNPAEQILITRLLNISASDLYLIADHTLIA